MRVSLPLKTDFAFARPLRARHFYRDTCAMTETTQIPPQIPQQSTPTWQMELLLSGGLIIACFELLGYLDASSSDWLSPLYHAQRMLILVVYIYAYAALLASSITFTCHLILRSLWVAIIGAQSVYSGGIKWENFIASERSARMAQDRLKNPAALVESLDNSSPVVFALGMLIVATLFFSLAMMVVVFALIAVFKFSVLAHWSEPKIFALIGGIGLAILIPAQLIDLFLAKRLGSNSRIARWANAIFMRATVLIAPKPFYFLSTLLLSNLGRWRGAGAFTMLLIATLFMSVFRTSQLRGLPTQPDYFASGKEPALSSAFYADQRAADAALTAPYIDSMISSGPYLQLRIPYQPGYFDQLAARSCNIKTRLATAAERAICFHKLIAIRLNGAALATPILLIHNESNETFELQLMLDARELTRGQHEITLSYPKAHPSDTGPSQARNFRIAFWR